MDYRIQLEMIAIGYAFWFAWSLPTRVKKDNVIFVDFKNRRRVA